MLLIASAFASPDVAPPAEPPILRPSAAALQAATSPARSKYTSQDGYRLTFGGCVGAGPERDCAVSLLHAARSATGCGIVSATELVHFTVTKTGAWEAIEGPAFPCGPPVKARVTPSTGELSITFQPSRLDGGACVTNPERVITLEAGHQLLPIPCGDATATVLTVSPFVLLATDAGRTR